MKQKVNHCLDISYGLFLVILSCQNVSEMRMVEKKSIIWHSNSDIAIPLALGPSSSSFLNFFIFFPEIKIILNISIFSYYW